MSTKVKVSEVLELKKSSQWKDLWFHEYFVKIGDEKCTISIGSKSEVPPGLEVGEHEVEAKPDYMGQKQYKLVKPKSGGFNSSFSGSKTGFTPRSVPVRNETSIVAQSSLKAAIEYITVTNHKASVEDVTEIASQFMAWVKSVSESK